MRQVILSSGHSTNPNGDRGAKGINDVWEGDLTVEIRDLVFEDLKQLGVIAKIDDNKNALAQTLSFFKSLMTGKNIAIDFHWNAFNSVANGCEVIVPNNPSSFERLLGTELLINICKAGLFRNRGLKTEGQTARKLLGWMRPPCENILIEMCFIDNRQDMLLYNANKVAISKTIARTIQKYVNS